MSAKTSAKGKLTKKLPSLFLSHGLYYFKITLDGKRKTFPTGTSVEADAIMEEKRILASLFPEDEEKIELVPKTFFQLLKLFSNMETRPRAEYGMPQVTERYLLIESRHAQKMIKLFPEKILSKPLSKLSKQDMKDCRAILISELEEKSAPNGWFCTLRRIIGKAYEMDWLDSNIIDKVQAPPRNCNKREGIELEEVKKIVCHEENFASKEEWYAYYIIATTGMRKSEFMAIQPHQFSYDEANGCYTLDICQAFKDYKYSIVGPPKCSKRRIIPLAKTTGERMKYLIDSRNDEKFPMKKLIYSNTWVRQRPIIEKSGVDFSLHRFRHSLESALIINDANHYLAGEYISWNGQDMGKVQYGYTHVFVKSLMPIADLIEKLFTEA